MLFSQHPSESFVLKTRARLLHEDIRFHATLCLSVQRREYESRIPRLRLLHSNYAAALPPPPSLPQSSMTTNQAAAAHCFHHTAPYYSTVNRNHQSPSDSSNHIEKGLESRVQGMRSTPVISVVTLQETISGVKNSKRSVPMFFAATSKKMTS